MISAASRRLPLNGNKHENPQLSFYLGLILNRLSTMNKFFIVSLVFFFALFGCTEVSAQTDNENQAPHYKIGIFAPLYLDSVFTKTTFRYRQSVPRFIQPAVDFVQGALIALDSLQDGEDYIDAFVYDTKSYTESVPDLIGKGKLDSLQLIIGSVKDAEYLQLADFALLKNIPFISVTYPNDAGITSNPFLVIMNPTLRAHCDAMYSYILQNHGTDKIYLVRQKGAQEDMVASYFKDFNNQDGQPLLPIEVINISNNNLTADFLKNKLDSNRQSVIIGGSLDETFAENIAKACFGLQKSYPIKLIGMPNWDNFQALFNKKNLPDLPIYYTTAYYNDKTDEYSKSLNYAYYSKYKIKPGDMAFKGYEAVYRFTKLLVKNGEEFMNRINDKTIKVFCDYNFRAVRMNNVVAIPDYFENKHLYVNKIMNGLISKAW